MLPFLPKHVELLKQVEQSGEYGHRFTNDMSALVTRHYVNSYMYHVVINDRGRAFLQGLVVGAKVKVTQNHKHYDLLKDRNGTIQSVLYRDRHPKDIFPVPYERTTIGWESEQRYASKVKSDSPVFLVIFDNEPWAQWCFYNVNDLAISG